MKKKSYPDPDVFPVVDEVADTLSGRPASGGQRILWADGLLPGLVGFMVYVSKCPSVLSWSVTVVAGVADVYSGRPASGGQRILWSVGLWPGIQLRV